MPTSAEYADFLNGLPKTALKEMFNTLNIEPSIVHEEISNISVSFDETKQNYVFNIQSAQGGQNVIQIPAHVINDKYFNDLQPDPSPNLPSNQNPQQSPVSQNYGSIKKPPQYRKQGYASTAQQDSNAQGVPAGQYVSLDLIPEPAIKAADEYQKIEIKPPGAADSDIESNEFSENGDDARQSHSNDTVTFGSESAPSASATMDDLRQVSTRNQYSTTVIKPLSAQFEEKLKSDPNLLQKYIDNYNADNALKVALNSQHVQVKQEKNGTFLITSTDDESIKIFVSLNEVNKLFGLNEAREAVIQGYGSTNAVTPPEDHYQALPKKESHDPDNKIEAKGQATSNRQYDNAPVLDDVRKEQSSTYSVIHQKRKRPKETDVTSHAANKGQADTSVYTYGNAADIRPPNYEKLGNLRERRDQNQGPDAGQANTSVYTYGNAPDTDTVQKAKRSTSPTKLATQDADPGRDRIVNLINELAARVEKKAHKP